MAARAHLAYGSMLSRQRRRGAAEAHFRAALDLDPDSVEGHLELGKLAQASGRLAVAIEHYAVARASGRPLHGIRFWHAAALSRLGRQPAARAALEEDLATVGDTRELNLLLARLLVSAADAGARDLARGQRRLAAAAGSEPDVLFAETAAMVDAAHGRFDQAQAWQQGALAVLEGLRPRISRRTSRAVAWCSTSALSPAAIPGRKARP